MMTLGWLSPNGELIEADYMSHIYIAEDICKKYYGLEEVWLPDDELINHGWVHITMTTFMDHEIHIIWKFGGHLTEAQKNYLKPEVEANINWLNKSCKMDLEEEGVI